MRIPTCKVIGCQQGSVARNLASAAVILFLTACNAESLEAIQNDLANAEAVNISLSVNDNGDLSIQNDETGTSINIDTDADDSGQY